MTRRSTGVFRARLEQLRDRLAGGGQTDEAKAITKTFQEDGSAPSPFAEPERLRRMQDPTSARLNRR